MVYVYNIRMNKFDLAIPGYSYFIGFAQADGHLSRRKSRDNLGKFSLEINSEDSSILADINLLLGMPGKIHYRVRDTNFKKNYASSTLTICKKACILEINKYIPFGAKTFIVKPPQVEYSKIDYIRGLIDADGSIGYTKKGIPFISFATKSEYLKITYLEYLKYLVGIDKVINRNTRDNIYNIVVFSTHAKKIITDLYYDNCISLKRKYNIAMSIKDWQPNSPRKYYGRCMWTKEEDSLLVANSSNLQEAAIILNRSLSSVKTHLWRIKTSESLPGTPKR